MAIIIYTLIQNSDTVKGGGKMTAKTESLHIADITIH